MISGILAWLANLVISVISATGYFGVAVLMAFESAGVPIPSEVVMPFSGYLASAGKFSLWLATFWATVGNLIGSLALYALGYYGGRRVVARYGKYFLLNEEWLDKSSDWFKKYGSPAIFFSRMTPIIRTYISLPAGLAKMNLLKFIVYTFVGSLPWNLALAYIGVVLGENWKNIEGYFRKFDYVILILIAVGLAWFLWSHYFKKKSAV